MLYLKVACSILLAAVFVVLINEQRSVAHLDWNQSLRRRPPKLLSDYNTSINQATCGIYYFYHVGKTGGTSVREWQVQLVKEGKESMEYLYTFDRVVQERTVWKTTYKHIEDFIRSGRLASKNSWAFVHHHHNTPGLHYTMPKLRDWKERLADQGCTLIAATVLREPLSRARSMFSYDHIPMERFPRFINTFAGSARYLLYNSCEPRKDLRPPKWCKKSPGFNNTGHALTEGEVNEVIGYLREFDIVKKTEELDEFIAESEMMLWHNSTMNDRRQTKRAPKKNKSVASVQWTEQMTEMMRPSLREDQIVWDTIFPVKVDSES